MKFFSVILFALFCSCVSLAARDTQTVVSIANENKELNEPVDFHLTGDVPLVNASVNLISQDAWLFFDNIRPSEVIEKYASMITISGEALQPGVNSRVDIYLHGTVVIPQDTKYEPLQVFTGANYSGNTRAYLVDSCYQDLETFDNAIQSFKLKRGYMATLANEKNGQGYSRVFIADKEDVEVSVLPHELNGKVSYIRCFRWEWVSKKGWCSSGQGCYNEVALTNSTWYYSWSADRQSLDGAEFVPIKQNWGWPGFSEINSKSNVTHLLGYNEPDRPEQANATVERAISQWPQMMQSGLRLGTPAIADNLSWLYSFLDECKARNYRVDYVAVHAYWGGSGGAQVVTDNNGNISPEKWYQKLKAIHDRTGLPIWITEWNNGANWTNEKWPSDQEGQQQKQLNDLKAILNVMDTCSFIERYSIYNWVGDQRALVVGKNEQGEYTSGGTADQKLTPAGEYYSNLHAPMAYNPAKAVIPTYQVVTPELKASYNVNSRFAEISWVDYNGELTDSYVLERKIDDGEYQELRTGTGQLNNEFSEELKPAESHTYTYRVKIKSGNTEKYSNEMNVDVPIVMGNGDIRYGVANLTDLAWKYFFFEEGASYRETPGVVFGGFSSSTRSLLSYHLQGTTVNGFRFKYSPWEYQNLTELSKAENAPYIVAKKGNYRWGDLSVEVGDVRSVNDDWKKVTFKQPFPEEPVVFVSPSSAKATYPFFARVRNVTKEGFEVHLTREKNLTTDFGRENICYLAITSGLTTVNGKKIKVGKTAEVVGELSHKAELSFEENFPDPAFYCTLLTSNDDFTSNLRYSGLTSRSVTFMKQREKSYSAAGTSGLDQVGWIVIEGGGTIGTSVEKIISEKERLLIYPTVATGSIDVATDWGTRIFIYNVGGSLVKSQVYSGTTISVSDLSVGMYILRTDKGESARFVKVN